MSDLRELTAAEMTKLLGDRGACPSKVVKVLLIGNSGAGKSLLCNCIVGRNVFAHKMQATSVTQQATFALCQNNGFFYVVCNVPGLIEANAANIARNKAAIEEAITLLPGVRSVCLLVASVEVGGKVAHEDYETFRALGKRVSFPPSSLLFVANKVGEVDDKGAFRNDLLRQMRTCLVIEPKVALVDFVGLKDRTNPSSPPMVRARAELFSAISSLSPCVPSDGPELLLEAERQRKAIAELQRQAEAQRVAAAQAAEHQRALEAQAAAQRAHQEELQRQHAAAIEQERRALEAQRAAAAQHHYHGRRRGQPCAIM